MNFVLRLLAGRLAVSLLVLVGVSMLIFAIARVIPGDPARIALGPNATTEQVDKLRRELRLDQPIWQQYGHFLSDLSRGELGTSLYTNRPVTKDIVQFLPATLELILIAGVMMVGIGLPLGIVAAKNQDGLLDNAVRVVSLLGVSAPSFVWAVILMVLFAFFLPLFPIAGRIGTEFDIPAETGFLLVDTLLAGQIDAFLDSLWHIALPAMALALSGIGQTARLTRASMVETYRQPYIEMAHAYGFPGLADRPQIRVPPLLDPGLDHHRARLRGDAR